MKNKKKERKQPSKKTKIRVEVTSIDDNVEISVSKGGNISNPGNDSGQKSKTMISSVSEVIKTIRNFLLLL